MSTTATDHTTLVADPGVIPIGRRRTMRIAEQGGTAPADTLARDIAAISAANRILANRITELETEVGRQSAVAERLRQRLAAEMGDNLATATAAADGYAAELVALQSTRLFRWTAPPRRVYRRVRRLSRLTR